MHINIKLLQKNWDAFGKNDPFWAVLAWPDKKDHKWTKEEFFALGRKEVDAVINCIRLLDFQVSYKKALDFGCGVGRLTQALASYFNEVYGVDIAPSMIALANQYNNFPEKCKYFLNERDDLSIFPGNSFDFIYTSITLQHMDPVYAKKYIREFLRILSPKGLLIFQMPSHRIEKDSETVRKRVFLAMIARRACNFLRTMIIPHSDGSFQPTMEMHGIKREEIIRFVEKNNGKMLGYVQNSFAGNDWLSYQYFVSKKNNDNDNK